MRRIAIGIILAVVAGCRDSTGPNSGQTRLAEARAKWAANGYHDYSYTIRALCFCAYINPMRATVLNDTLRSVIDTKTGEAVDPRYVQTIEGLFAFIERGYGQPADVLEVDYDAQRGFPTHIVYDGSYMAADDEVTYDVSDVVRIARDPLP